jgi:phosphonate transport system substrate-binding protein
MAPMLSRRSFAGCCAVLALAAGARTLAAQETLTLAFIPQENPEKLLGDIEVITDYLTDEIGLPVKGYVTLDHAAAVEALRTGGADISFSGALPYVLAHEQVGAEVLLSEVYRGRSSYVARIFVREGNGIDRLADLEGKTIAFADPISESGYLYPLEIIADAGLIERGDDPQSFFGRVYFAGGVSEFADLLLSPEQQSQVKWIAESEPIPAHAVIARKDLDPQLKQRFVDAMLQLNEPQNHWLLKHVYAPDGYVEARHEAYEPVADVARRYGLLS